MPWSNAKTKTDYNAWATKLSNTVIENKNNSFVQQNYWCLNDAMLANAIVNEYQSTKDERYLNYALGYADKYVDTNGTIATYNSNEKNLTDLYGGNLLFELYNQTRDVKYLKAVRLLRRQIYSQPRISIGAFWPSKSLNDQIWIDNTFACMPFYCRYAAIFDEPKVFDDIINQFEIVDVNTFDKKSGLNFQGWNTSKNENWANPKTGKSACVVTKSMGLYMMAIVDVLDFFPINHPKRASLILLLNRLSASMLKNIDKKSGLWYHVTNMQKSNGNYLETSGSAMVVYALAKGVNKEYLPIKYQKVAEKAFDGLIKYSTKQTLNDEIILLNSCGEIGLGGNPYRDGSFEYYTSLRPQDDDPTAVAAFIMAALELNK